MMKKIRMFVDDLKNDYLKYIGFGIYSVLLITLSAITAGNNARVLTCREMGGVPLINKSCISRQKYENLKSLQDTMNIGSGMSNRDIEQRINRSMDELYKEMNLNAS